MFPTKCVPKIFLESDILKMYRNSFQRLIGFTTLVNFSLAYTDWVPCVHLPIKCIVCQFPCLLHQYECRNV